MRLSSSGAAGPCRVSSSLSMWRGDAIPVLTRASSAKARFAYLEDKVGGGALRVRLCFLAGLAPLFTRGWFQVQMKGIVGAGAGGGRGGGCHRGVSNF